MIDGSGDETTKREAELLVTQRQVEQLLRDWRTWHTAFGAAAATDAELNLQAKGSYGPAGLIFTGAEFDTTDLKLLARSFRLLRGAMLRLRNTLEVGKHSTAAGGDTISGFQAFASLFEPYLGDPADPGIVHKWRTDLAELEKENQRRALCNPPQPARVALITPRRLLERHDAAIKWLARDLQGQELHAIFSRPMSEEEEKAGEDQNAEIYAVFHRFRVSGLTEAAAIAQTAENFHVSRDMVERIVEFRSDVKPDECVWGGCERAPFSQNLCQKHYMQEYRTKKKTRSA